MQCTCHVCTFVVKLLATKLIHNSIINTLHILLCVCVCVTNVMSLIDCDRLRENTREGGDVIIIHIHDVST